MVQIQEWTISVFGSDGAPETATRVPFDVHSTLIASGALADPFVGTREFDPATEELAGFKWKAVARFAFVANAAEPELLHVLAFDGLDTVAEVFLNGVSVAKSNNMFVPLRIPVSKEQLKDENVVEVIFESATAVAKALEETHGAGRLWNGDSSRLHLRKTQYHWGWDWGPTFVTCGIWKDVRFESFQARIADLNTIIELNDSLTEATVKVELEVEGIASLFSVPGETSAVIAIENPDGSSLVTESFNQQFSLQENNVILTHKIANPKLWYPVGAGAQPLYKITATLLHTSVPNPLSIESHKFGIRRVKLVETPLPQKSPAGPSQTSFYFEVNDRPVLLGGSNWIPADSFLARVTRDKYERWLRLLIQGNQNTARVWGGGIYEHDAFYELCDELGILVWQDFMFACGSYPSYPEFVQNVDAEARATVKRLRKYASIAIFTGNNEDYQLAESLPELGYQPGNDDEKQWLSSKFPARYIYEKILPKAVSDLWPGTAYKPGSPWSSGGKASGDLNTGDAHQWNVWHGTQERYQDYGKLAGRFVSEFGMEGYPVVETVKAFFEPGTPAAEIHPFSAVVDHHNKADGAARRIGLYMAENLRFGTNLEEFVYASQLIQSEALSAATSYGQWRREWGSDEDRRVGGALVWQLNDCWPVVSWAIVDYFYRPKPAYYSIKRQLAPIVLGISRKVTNKKTGASDAEVWGVNITDDDAIGTIVFESFDYATGHVLVEKEWGPVTIPANSSIELGSVEGLEGKRGVYQIFSVQFKTDGKVVSSASDWPQPLKHLPVSVPTRGVKIEQVSVEANVAVLRVSAARPTKAVWLKFGGIDEADLIVSDNFVDLVPGQVVDVVVKGWRQGITADKIFYNSDFPGIEAEKVWNKTVSTTTSTVFIAGGAVKTTTVKRTVYTVVGE
ncbi:hypothetical protein HK100_011427 [Physocladia obscura]|uniref:Beta-mannosidase B n=1 Tax=Physocladia obscura TaxID=109957 RepID=A0AAD5T2Q3_9FUNG|nr:hypothetical protein HK100_011427 [Physocladia obscura]